MNELKHIDFKAGSFECIIKDDTGKVVREVEYFLEGELSIERSVWKENYVLFLEKGISPGKQSEDWSKCYSLCFEDKPNEEKLRNIATLCYNNVTGFKNFFENKPIVLKLCALFINTKDEDRRFINELMVSEKISDWHLSGYAISNFFLLAITFLEIEVKSYAKATSDILAVKREFEENIVKLMATPISS